MFLLRMTDLDRNEVLTTMKRSDPNREERKPVLGLGPGRPGRWPTAPNDLAALGLPRLGHGDCLPIEG